MLFSFPETTSNYILIYLTFFYIINDNTNISAYISKDFVREYDTKSNLNIEKLIGNRPLNENCQKRVTQYYHAILKFTRKEVKHKAWTVSLKHSGLSGVSQAIPTFPTIRNVPCAPKMIKRHHESRRCRTNPALKAKPESTVGL